MKYLLDTDSVSYAIRGHGQVAAVIQTKHPSEIAISSITYAELIFGAEKRNSARLKTSIRRFLSQIEIVSFDSDAAEEFGRIASRLAKGGTPIGEFDVLIAAHAVRLRRVFVTNNTRHFSRIKGLKIENWT